MSLSLSNHIIMKPWFLLNVLVSEDDNILGEMPAISTLITAVLQRKLCLKVKSIALLFQFARKQGSCHFHFYPKNCQIKRCFKYPANKTYLFI